MKKAKEKQELESLRETIALKDREIKDIKRECAKQFEAIKDLCTCNEYGGKLDKLGRIEEIADENFFALMKDLFIDEKEEKEKIIELKTNREIRK